MRKLIVSAVAAAGGAWALHKWRRRMDFTGRSVVITGGSRGLGLELARRFAAHDARLTLLARDEEELERAAERLRRRGADVQVAVCDVGEEAAVQRAVAHVLERRGRIDVVVNNAGIIVVGPLAHMTQADFAEAMDVHFWGPLYLTRAVRPTMREQGGGRIVNISSIGGLVSVPHLLPYSASKFALTGLSDGLRAELAQDGIHVTTVCPGLMRTGSHVNAWFLGQHAKEFSWFALSNAFPTNSMSARRAARKIVRACRYGRAHLTLTPQARWLARLDRLFPNLTAAVAKRVSRALPAPRLEDGNERRRGWEAPSPVAPSLFTRLADRQVVRNNERPQRFGAWPAARDPS